MSRIRTNVITNRLANGAPTVSNGLVISGVTTTSDVNVGAGVTLNVYGGATYSGIITCPNVSAASSVTATTYYGSGANLTGISADKIFEGNTEAEVVDTGSDGHFKVTTEGNENFRVTSDRKVGINRTSPTRHLHVYSPGAGFPAKFESAYSYSSVEFADTGTVVVPYIGSKNDHLVAGIGNTERLRIGSAGQLGIAGANYGTSGQVLTSQGASSPIQWATLTTGKVLQMTYKRGGVTTSSNSGGWTDSVESGLNVDITPISATSRIIIQMHSVGGNTSSGRSYFLRLRRKVNNTGDTNVASFQIGDGSNGGIQSLALTHVDYDASSPFNTSHVRNYRIRFGQDGSGTARFDYATTSVLYCLEIQ